MTGNDGRLYCRDWLHALKSDPYSCAYLYVCTEKDTSKTIVIIEDKRVITIFTLCVDDVLLLG